MSQGGVTCTVADQEVTLNGTALASFNLVLFPELKIDDFSSGKSIAVQSGLPYSLSRTVAGGYCNTEAEDWVRDTDGNIIQNGDGAFTPSVSAVGSIGAWIPAGATFDHYAFRLQLERGGAATVWEASPAIVSHSDPIAARWKMKVNHLGIPNMMKTIKKIWLACRTNTATKLGITYFTDGNPGGTKDTRPIYISSFSFETIDFAAFTFGIDNWFGEWRKVPPMKNAVAFSIQFDNAEASQDLNVSDIIVEYVPVKEVRRSV